MQLVRNIFLYKMPTSNVVHATLLGFRALVSLSMINTHGMKKVLDIEGTMAHIPDPFGIGGALSTYISIGVNIFLAGFVAIGLLTRLSSLGILSVTLSGFFIVHANDPWAVRDVPLMYSLAFLLILLLGPGKYSLDQWITKQLKKGKS